MGLRTGLGLAMLGFALACGGGGEGGGGLIPVSLGSSVGPHASATRDFLQKENPGIPLKAYNVGEEFRVGDVSYRVDKLVVMEGENQLPWIKNLDERNALSKPGRKALAIEFSRRNETPMKMSDPAYKSIFQTDGEKGSYSAYNEKLYREEHGIPEIESLPPGQWSKDVLIAVVNEGGYDGAAWWVRLMERQYDPTDPSGRRKIEVLIDHALVDLGTAEKGPHINPAKR
jgi:hypothetical protein